MKLLTKAIEAKLRKNSAAAGKADIDPVPVLKLFCPWGAATWLLTELDEDGRLFGLCDLGMGEPELGYVALEELKGLKGPLGLGIERDLWFKGDEPLSVYTAAAATEGRIAA